MIKNIVVLLILCVVLYGVTLAAPTVRVYLYTTLPTNDKSSESMKRVMTKQWEREVDNAVKQVEASVMNIKVSDVITYMGKTKKMIDDAQAISKYIQQEVEKFTKKS